MNQAKKMGISQLVLLIGAVASFSGTMGSILEDGKVNWGDAGKITDLFAPLKDFSNIDFNKILPQVSDLDEGEMNRLNLVFDSKFDLKNETIEAKIEEGLDVINKAVQSIVFFANIRSKIRMV